MAAPVLQNVTGTCSSGTTFSVTAAATSPVNGDYRIMVVNTNNRSSGQPVTVTPPAGWATLHISPAGAGDIRTWVFGQVWTPATTTGNLVFSHNMYYSVQIGRVSGYTLGGPIVAGPRAQVIRSNTTQLPSLTLNSQAEALRIDFYGGFYNSGANSTANITVPAGQTASAIVRPSTAIGYITRVGTEIRNTAGFTGTRTATISATASGSATAVIFGGWKVLTNKQTTTTLNLTKASVGRKAVTLQTTTSLGVGPGSSANAGRSSAGPTSTVVDVISTARHVFLTRTDLALTQQSAGAHHSIGDTVTQLDVAHIVDGFHVAEPAQTETNLRLVASVAARVGGGRLPPPSVVDGFTAQYQPTDKPLRFLFQDIRTGKWLNWDVPLVQPEITYTLSGSPIIRGRIGPDDLASVQGIDAWATWLHVEEGGQIRASAIVQPLALDGQDLVIEASGVAGYPFGIPFTAELSAIQIDPAEVVRQLWTHLQSFSDARLGVTVSATATPRRLGDPETIAIDRDFSGRIVYRGIQLDDQGRTRVNQDQVPASTFAKLVNQGYPLFQDNVTGQLVLLVHPNDLAAATTGIPARVNEAGNGIEIAGYTSVAAKPYELAWWNEVDIGREIENLAKQTPFDFAENPRWAADRLSVEHHIEIGYPRLGTKRTDLAFNEDENLLSAVLLRESPGHFASQVMVRGAGEGRAAIRAQSGTPATTRIRRISSLTDKTITDRVRGQAVADDEVRRRLAAITITEITIDATHDNAPMGSFAVGDDILVRGRLPYFGEVALWHRITSFTWRPDSDEVVIQLQRSEQFAYGRLVA